MFSMSRFDAKYVTPDDFHSIREGEPIGYVPNEGDLIFYAMRHTPWSSAERRMIDGHDEQGEWKGPVLVRGTYKDRKAQTGYWLVDPARPNDDSRMSWIDLGWWICKQHIEDGALW